MSFLLDLTRFAEKTKTDLDRCIRYITLAVATDLVMLSPVDTGRFRANWQFAPDVAPSGFTDDTDKPGGATIARLTGQIEGVRAGSLFWIVNNLPYAIPLEHGHSLQAPAGMVAITVDRFQSYVDDAVRRL